MNAASRAKINFSYWTSIVAILAVFIASVSLLAVQNWEGVRGQDLASDPTAVVARKPKVEGSGRSALLGLKAEHLHNQEIRKTKRELMIVEPWGVLSDLITKRAQFDRNSWLKEIGMIIEAAEVPHWVRVEAYAQLDRSGQLIYAGDLMKSFISEQLEAEAINFYQSLPYDSSARRLVSSSLWEWIMKSNSFEKSVRFFNHIDDEFGDGVRSFVAFHSENFDEVRKIESLFEKLPVAVDRSLFLDNILTSGKSGLGFEQYYEIAASTQIANLSPDRIATILASHHQMSHSDLISYLSIAGNEWAVMSVAKDIAKQNHATLSPKNHSDVINLAVDAKYIRAYVTGMLPVLSAMEDVNFQGLIQSVDSEKIKDYLREEVGKARYTIRN